MPLLQIRNLASGKTQWRHHNQLKRHYPAIKPGDCVTNKRAVKVTFSPPQPNAISPSTNSNNSPSSLGTEPTDDDVETVTNNSTGSGETGLNAVNNIPSIDNNTLDNDYSPQNVRNDNSNALNDRLSEIIVPNNSEGVNDVPNGGCVSDNDHTQVNDISVNANGNGVDENYDDLGTLIDNNVVPDDPLIAGSRPADSPIARRSTRLRTTTRRDEYEYH